MSNTKKLEHKRKYNEEYWKANCEALREGGRIRVRKWREKNPQKTKEYNKKFKEKNPEYAKEYYKKNLQRFKEKHKEYYRKKTKLIRKEIKNMEVLNRGAR